MNYKVSLLEMDRMAKLANSKKPTISLEEMRKQAQNLKDKSTSLLRIGDHVAFTEIYNILYIHAFRRLNNEDEARGI